MRSFTTLATLLLSMALVACSSIETHPTDTAAFAAGNYKYFKWRSQPLANTGQSDDLLYVMDPIVRREVNSALSQRGFVLDPERAQFSVDYLQAVGLRQGVSSQDASGGIDPIPSARPNRQVNQAMVDNAHALAGVQTTNNVAIQFNDVASQQEVWRVVITKIINDVNNVDTAAMERNINRAINQGFKTLPGAS
ncbi:MAG: DUF4136 domain-containing protein [Halioglobus sp.]